MVVLAVRPLERYTTMGRETFLAKFIWEDDWPVVNPGIGMLSDTVEINLPEWSPLKDPESYTNRTRRKTAIPGTEREYVFANMNELGDEFLFLRNYPDDMYELVKDEGLKLKASKDDIKAVASPSYICIRQQHHHFKSSAYFDISSLKNGESAGLVLMQNNLYNLRAEVKNDVCYMILCQNGEDNIIGSVDANVVKKDSCIELSILVDGLKTKVFAADVELGEAKVANLSTEVAGGFVGCCIGIYASANGCDSDTKVTFKDFTYKAL